MAPEIMESTLVGANQFVQTLHQDHDWLALSFTDQVHRLKQLFHQTYPGQWEADDTTLYSLFHVYRANVLAVAAYDPEERLPVPVTLLRTHPSGSDLADHADATWGWATYADGPVELHWVAGEHQLMLEEPYVQEVVAHLAATLTKS